jgi:hypothetical protein
MGYSFEPRIMKFSQKKIVNLIFRAAFFLCIAAHGQNLDQTGVTLLRAVATNVDGSGIRVAQPEANTDGNTNDPSAFEVSPGAASFPASRFTYISAAGTSNAFPNSVGNESGHADGVAQYFYGLSGGVATNVAHVDNFDADYFVNNYIVSNLTVLDDLVVNQSFTFSEQSVGDQQQIDSEYDDYSAQYKITFVSAANNYGNYDPPNNYDTTNVVPPGTSYNCISVGAYANGTYYNSIGPTIDNGRCKPDITAPAGVTSDSTPQVSGAAALLMQAGLRGDGGSDTNSAFDMRTIKALLLNGAVKPADWTNSNSSPLDFRYGAGVLNVFNSYEQLAGGKHGYIVSTTVSTGGAHPPAANSGTIGVLSGWDFNTNISSVLDDAVNHYFFNVTNSSATAAFTATATLVWNRQQGQPAINNLDLFLFNCANSNLVACSTSLVDNVEHIFLPRLPQGRYDLQVWKAGGSFVSSSESYALAWNFSSPTLAISNGGTNVNLSWPIYPAGFAVAATTNLSAPNWSTNNLPPPVFTNSQNVISIPATNAVQFFRLQTPNF